jgi:hypothetical protein
MVIPLSCFSLLLIALMDHRFSRCIKSPGFTPQTTAFHANLQIVKFSRKLPPQPSSSSTMSSSRRAYLSNEKVLDSSSDESITSPTLLRRTRTPSSSSPSTSSSRSSSPVSSSPSPSRSPSPGPSSYRYSPPSTHHLSTSKEKSIIPKLGPKDELFLLRVPSGVRLEDVQLNFRKQKARIGGEQWKLLSQESGDVRVIQGCKDSEEYEFGLCYLMGLI